jgi:hypothetical protein
MNTTQYKPYFYNIDWRSQTYIIYFIIFHVNFLSSHWLRSVCQFSLSHGKTKKGQIKSIFAMFNSIPVTTSQIMSRQILTLSRQFVAYRNIFRIILWDRDRWSNELNDNIWFCSIRYYWCKIRILMQFLLCIIYCFAYQTYIFRMHEYYSIQTIFFII